MKATYENSFCTNNDCIHYFEDMCMVAMSEEGTEIEPFNNKERDSKMCKEFKAGTYITYLYDMLFPRRRK